MPDPVAIRCEVSVVSKRGTIPLQNHNVSGGHFRISFLSVLLLWSCAGVRADNGFAAMGYLTYTRFDAGSNSTHQKVMMFEVTVLGSAWHIRTEPLIEGTAVGYYEVSNSTNGFVLCVKALEFAYNRADSPFQTLRAELKQSKPDEVSFKSPPPSAVSAVVSNYLRQWSPGETKITNRADNIAVATVFKGDYPPADPSYAALLRFVFRTPDPLSDGANELLPQIWDDGNSEKIRFRRARWRPCAESPKLVSGAVFDWIGKELLPDGTWADLNVSDVDRPLETAVVCEVGATTNFAGSLLPLEFRLTRFKPKRSRTGEQLVSSTVAATVTRLSTPAPGKDLEVKFPGKTFVTDFRLGTGGSRHTPLRYLVDSDVFPGTDQLPQSSFYMWQQGEATKAERSAHFQ